MLAGVHYLLLYINTCVYRCSMAPHSTEICLELMAAVAIYSLLNAEGF